MEKLAGFSPDVHIGSLVSLTSKGEIRYEGALHTLDTAKSTLVLKNVHSYGTEGRGTNALQICPGIKAYDFIVFRDTDIKDLSVLPLPARYDVFTNNALGAENSHGYTLGTVLGVPVLPYSSCTQEFMNWWQCIFSPVANCSNIPLISPLSIVCTNACTDLAHSVSSLSLQENHGPVFLPKLEQVSTITSANGCETQSLQVPHHLPYQGSTSGKWLIPGRVVFQSKIRPKRWRFHIKPLKVQPLLQQQPLLPLPVSESEHLRLIRESMCSANPEHMRRPKEGSRGRVKGAQPREGAPSQTQHEASSCKLQFSEELNLKAKDEQFNKKELWHDLHLNDQEVTTADENEDNTSEDILHKQTPSRKLLFVEDFFDLPPSTGEDNIRETGAQATKASRQRKIDLETFGVGSRRRRRRRNGPRKEEEAATTPSNSERNGCR